MKKLLYSEKEYAKEFVVQYDPILHADIDAWSCVTRFPSGNIFADSGYTNYMIAKQSSAKEFKEKTMLPPLTHHMIPFTPGLKDLLDRSHDVYLSDNKENNDLNFCDLYTGEVIVTVPALVWERMEKK